MVTAVSCYSISINPFISSPRSRLQLSICFYCKWLYSFYTTGWCSKKTNINSDPWQQTVSQSCQTGQLLITGLDERSCWASQASGASNTVSWSEPSSELLAAVGAWLTFSLHRDARVFAHSRSHMLETEGAWQMDGNDDNYIANDDVLLYSVMCHMLLSVMAD